jgi:hypothetical protein
MLQSKLYTISIYLTIVLFTFSTLEKDATTIASYSHQSLFVKSSNYDCPTSTTGVRIAFEDGFYIRWNRLITNPTEENFKDNSTIIDDGLHHHTHSGENFDEFFDETFNKHRQMHPATSERAHRRYSYESGDCLGLYNLLINNNGEKYESTAKCLTNVTVFFISKQKLLAIFNTYSLWNVVWLEMSMFA